ncbi:baseplate assembly protein [Azohydromonas lata]|uniref:Baseplate J/gp47 family protein n=1 Tax=Azohydromonas lata TaxID=45677 RepID=A0ABU5IDF4_9BURK|nr:baseplate J/gp47 family protein [Azohydromonas lata]MDZ5456997.1 baseplate J/gp47 family protein [Azohydromonas lata]
MIDLSLLPPPDVVETVSFESILAERKARAVELMPELAATIDLESEPVNVLLQESAYREVLLRQRINEAACGVMLATATGADLDQLGANVGVARLVIDAGDASAVPPVAPTYESDAAFRGRILLSFEAYTTAGSRQSYEYHALSASGDVLDASAVSPTPGHVTVYVLSRSGVGTASAPLLAAVSAALSAEDVRPLTDTVSVLSASIVQYQITATLHLQDGPDPDVVRTAALTAARAYAAETHRLGRVVSLSGLYRALHQSGVLRVDLTAPAGNVAITDGQAPYCTAITLTTDVLDG